MYQHDTPDKYLFAYDKRAYSHGCMRVQDPPSYAEVLLSIIRPHDGYTEDRIHRMISEGGEQDIQFPTFIPVNLTYQTAFVDDNGKLQFRDDVYGRDRQLLAILKGSDLKMADVAVEHHDDVRAPRGAGHSGRHTADRPLDRAAAPTIQAAARAAAACSRGFSARFPTNLRHPPPSAMPRPRVRSRPVPAARWPASV